MNPQTAILILGNAAKQAKLSFNDHVQVQTAIETLQQYIQQSADKKESNLDNDSEKAVS